MKFKSIKFRLFIVLFITVVSVIFAYFIFNISLLSKFYLSVKQREVIKTYSEINNYYKSSTSESDIKYELEKLNINKNMEITIIGNSRKCYTWTK